MRFNPHTPLAGEPLQPLGHASRNIFQYDREFITPGQGVGPSASLIVVFFDSRLWGAFKFESFMQSTNRKFHVLVMNQNRRLDFTGTDHLDVDVFIG